MREYQGAERDIPELFLAMSPTMRELYNIYGDTVAFDITYNLVKPRSTTKKSNGDFESSRELAKICKL
jgi:hypothetical protein